MHELRCEGKPVIVDVEIPEIEGQAYNPPSAIESQLFPENVFPSALPVAQPAIVSGSIEFQ